MVAAMLLLYGPSRKDNEFTHKVLRCLLLALRAEMTESIASRTKIGKSIITRARVGGCKSCTFFAGKAQLAKVGQ